MIHALHYLLNSLAYSALWFALGAGTMWLYCRACSAHRKGHRR